MALCTLRERERDNTLIPRAMSGASPGPSGWTEELLYDVLDNDVVATAFAPIVTDVMNGHVGPETLGILRCSTLVGLAKPDGGVRPVALGELFSKVAELLAVDAARPKLVRYFGGLQYGCHFKGGAERIVHHVRGFVRHTLEHKLSGHVVVTIDQKNAFNTPQRQFMWDKLSNFPVANVLSGCEELLDDGLENRLRERCRTVHEANVLGRGLLLRLSLS